MLKDEHIGSPNRPNLNSLDGALSGESPACPDDSLTWAVIGKELKRNSSLISSFIQYITMEILRISLNHYIVISSIKCRL